MDVSVFFKELKRMCKSLECKDCPIRGSNGKCRVLNPGNIGEVVPIVKKWSKEHPQKTRLQDFFGKYPNAPKDADGTPKTCCENLGYCKDCDESGGDCKKCWNMPLEEE